MQAVYSVMLYGMEVVSALVLNQHLQAFIW